MIGELVAIGLATLLCASGMWLLMPRGVAGGRVLGTLLALLGLGILASRVPPLGDLATAVVFYILAAVTVIAAAAAVTFRSPVHCAIWFALSLLGTAGLFLMQGAQFLGVATVVVYAGAILVTFLFVLMLCQPEGSAFYDRLSWDTAWASLAGMLIVGVMTLAVVGVFRGSGETQAPIAQLTPEQLDDGVLAQQHMAHLGRELFSRYLFAVEVAGTLLLVALVGAVAILSEASRQMPAPPKTVSPRLDPRIVNSIELQHKPPVTLLAEPSAQEVMMDELALLQNYLIVGALLFGIGLVGLLSRRNMIIMFLAAEMMLQGVSVSFVAWGRYHNDWGGQILVIFILTVAACEAGIALALVLTLYQRSGSLDIAHWHSLREENRPAYVDLELPEPGQAGEHVWPHLTRAGIRPTVDGEEASHRSHV